MNITFKEDENGNRIISLDKKYASHLDKLSSSSDFEHNCKVSLSNFSFFLNMISNKINVSGNFIMENCPYMADKYMHIIDEFQEIGFDFASLLDRYNPSNTNYWNLKKEYIDRFLNECENPDDIQRLIYLFKKYIKFQTSVYRTLELIDIKDELFDDFADVAPKRLVHKYKAKYESLLAENPFHPSKVEKLYKKIQDFILEDFKKRITKVENYKPGEIFKFICHSTESVEWDFDHIDNYISASLLTETLTDTFRNPFGLILNPDYIVSMDPQDAYTKNNAKDESELSLNSVLPRIIPMGRMIAETAIYNEVVVKKGPLDDLFLGVFCITDGSKELHPTYIDALTLRESFPDLPLIDIDMTMYLPKNSLSPIRDELIDAIREELGITTPIFDGYYDMYEPFWNQYMQLKKARDYSLSDILSLFYYYYQVFESNTNMDDKQKNGPQR